MERKIVIYSDEHVIYSDVYKLYDGRDALSDRTFPYQVFGQFRLDVCLHRVSFWFRVALDIPSVG